MRGRCIDDICHGHVAARGCHGLVVDADEDDGDEGAGSSRLELTALLLPIGHSGVICDEEEDEGEDNGGASGTLESESATALLPPSGHLGLVADEEVEGDGTFVLEARTALLPPTGLVADDDDEEFEDEADRGGSVELCTALLPPNDICAGLIADEDEELCTALLPPNDIYAGLIADEAEEHCTALLPPNGSCAGVIADEDEDDDQCDGSESPPRFGLAVGDEHEDDAEDGTVELVSAWAPTDFIDTHVSFDSDASASDIDMCDQGDMLCGDESASDSDTEMPAGIGSLEDAPIANDMPFSFTWAVRWFVEVKRIFGTDVVLERLCTRMRYIGSDFSGLGTAELSTIYLSSACQAVMRRDLMFRFVFACDISLGCRSVLKTRLHGTCVYQDLWDRFPGFDVRQYTHGETFDFDSARLALLSQSGCLAHSAPCFTHEGCCAFPRIDSAVAGSPCIAWSRAGKRRGRKHPITGVLLAWCVWVLCAKPKVAIHENVIGFDTQILEELLGEYYFIQHVRASPSHMGFPFIARRRIYSVLRLRTALRRPPVDVQQVYDRIVAGMQYRAEDSLAWIFRASDEQLLQEENHVRANRGLAPLSQHSADWTYLLTAKQQARLLHHLQTSDGSIWDLTQTERFARSRYEQLPTLRRGSNRLWSRTKKRWVLQIELRAAMGYPVFPDLAHVANVPCEDVQGPRFAIGNAMHVANVGCVLLLGWLFVD